MWPKGIKTGGEGVEFPELTIVASNIIDIEIITSSCANTSASKKSTMSTKSVNSGSKTVKSNSSDRHSQSNSHTNTSTPSIHSTPSILVPPKQTFPSGNARKNLPSEDFDFLGNLARFDKAKEFKIIQAEDLIPMEDRLVSINSPQRKLGINENVLDERDSGRVIRKTPTTTLNSADNIVSDVASTVVNKNNEQQATSINATHEHEQDIIMDKFKHLSFKPPQQVRSPIFIEDGSSDESTDDDTSAVESYNLPIIKSSLYREYMSSLSEGEIDRIRLISSLNLSHHLLTCLNPSKSLVLLLGVGEESILCMEAVSLYLNHNRFSSNTNNNNNTVYGIFTAGGPGSGGKRIELTSPALKSAKKRLSSYEEVEFVTSLAEIVKLENVVVIDALGIEAELTANALKGLTNWLNSLISTATAALSSNNPVSDAEDAEKIVYGIEGTLLKQNNNDTNKNNKNINSNTRSHVQLISFGLPRDTIIPSLSASNSLLLVDSGIPGKCQINENIDTFQIFSNSFVSELEY